MTGTKHDLGRVLGVRITPEMFARLGAFARQLAPLTISDVVRVAIWHGLHCIDVKGWHAVEAARKGERSPKCKRARGTSR